MGEGAGSQPNAARHYGPADALRLLFLVLLQDFWFAVYYETTTSDETQACNSAEPASTVHPSEATWVCEYGPSWPRHAMPSLCSYVFCRLNR